MAITIHPPGVSPICGTSTADERLSSAICHPTLDPPTGTTGGEREREGGRERVREEQREERGAEGWALILFESSTVSPRGGVSATDWHEPGFYPSNFGLLFPFFHISVPPSLSHPLIPPFVASGSFHCRLVRPQAPFRQQAAIITNNTVDKRETARKPDRTSNKQQQAGSNNLATNRL